MRKIDLYTAIAFLVAATSVARLAHADDKAELLKQVAAGTTIIEADCTKSDVTLVSTFTLKCTDKPMHISWPGGKASMIFVAADDKGTPYSVSFNADGDSKPQSKQAVMQISSVRFDPVAKPGNWKTFPAKGSCELHYQDDASQMIDRIDCVAAAGDLAKFNFSTGAGATHGTK